MLTQLSSLYYYVPQLQLLDTPGGIGNHSSCSEKIIQRPEHMTAL